MVVSTLNKIIIADFSDQPFLPFIRQLLRHKLDNSLDHELLVVRDCTQQNMINALSPPHKY